MVFGDSVFRNNTTTSRRSSRSSRLLADVSSGGFPTGRRCELASERGAGFHRGEYEPWLLLIGLAYAWERHHEIPNCYVGECRLSSCGLLGTLCLRNLPIYKRTHAGCLGSRQFNLPGYDSWQASRH